VNYLVNINGGEDVLMIILKEADRKSVAQIDGEIREAGKRIHLKRG
jgi:hypothetical protein